MTSTIGVVYTFFFVITLVVVSTHLASPISGIDSPRDWTHLASPIDRADSARDWIHLASPINRTDSAHDWIHIVSPVNRTNSTSTDLASPVIRTDSNWNVAKKVLTLVAIKNKLLHLNDPVIKQLTEPLFDLGEGPHWDAARKVLYFVDIEGKRLHRYDPQTAVLTFASFDETVNAVFLVQNTTDKFYVGVGKTLTEVTWDGTNTTKPCFRKLYTVDKDEGDRFNDGEVDSAGRLWFGTKKEPELKKGALYRLFNDFCRLEPILKDVSISNGITWSNDDKYMFHIDTPTKQVVKYEYDIHNGSIKLPGQKLIDFKEKNIECFPDGMTIDNNDDLWIACYNGSQVVKVSSRTGELLTQIKMPVPLVTSVAFGDDSFQTLYVTTAKYGLSDAELKKYPLSGSLFSISNLNVTGHASNAVSGCLGQKPVECI